MIVDYFISLLYNIPYIIFNRYLNMVSRVVNGKWVEISWQEELQELITAHGLIPLEQKYPNEEKRLDVLTHKILFDNGETDFSKSMWRMSSGSRQKAFELAQRIGAHWGYIISIDDFDWACAMITDGCEVEWLSD